MTTYKLEVTEYDPMFSNDYIYGTVSLAKNEAFRILEKKLLESGQAEDCFGDYLGEEPYSKLWKEPKKTDGDYAVDDWFNDNCELDGQDSACEFYNSTIGHSDIVVTINRDYLVKLDGDTFIAHVDYVQDEMYKNTEAISLAKKNTELGEEYVEKYFSADSSEEFKEEFEQITNYEGAFGVDPKMLRTANPEDLDDFDKLELEDFRPNMEAHVADLDVNWTTVWNE